MMAIRLRPLQGTAGREILIFFALEKCSITGQTLKGGFTPAAVALPPGITPKQVLRHPRLERKGRYGKDRSIPLLDRTSVLNFISRVKEFCQSHFFTVFLKIICYRFAAGASHRGRRHLIVPDGKVGAISYHS